MRHTQPRAAADSDLHCVTMLSLTLSCVFAFSNLSLPLAAYPSPIRIDMTWTGRSEEHTSELQSLMRISYAVFCLKKKKNKLRLTHHTSYYTIHTRNPLATQSANNAHTSRAKNIHI